VRVTDSCGVMKTILLLSLAGMLVIRACAALTVTPSTISNSFNGEVTLTINGLSGPGQTVVVEKFYDWDNDTTVSAGDQLMQRFKVTDGLVTSVAGRRNINVPGDDIATASVIQTKLYLTPDEIPARLDGRFIFRVSPDGPGFAPFTAALTVTQQDHGGSGISGRVVAAAVPVSGAMVIITSGAPDDFDVVGLTKTDASGNYSLKLPPGSYRPVPVKPPYVFDVGAAPAFTVTAGAVTSAGDAALAPGPRTVSGTVRDDAATANARGGMLVYGFGSGGTFAFTFSDAAGSYALPAAAGEVEVGVLETQSAVLGLIRSQAGADATAGNVTGLHITLRRPDALIYGTVRTPQGTPVPWLDIYGDLDDGQNLQGFSVTDASGAYTLAALAGQWDLEIESPGYLSPFQSVDIASAGIAALLDVTVRPVTAHLRGTVRDNNGQAVPNVEIYANDYTGTNAWSFTDAAGNFSLGVHGGPGGTAKTWSIQLNQNSEENPATHISSPAEFEVTDGQDINGINYLAYLVTAHLRGAVRDENNDPVSGGNLYATQNGTDAITGTNINGSGEFDIPVVAGTWRIGMSFPVPGGMIAQDDMHVTTTAGTDVNGLVFRLRRTTGTITGSVRNTQGAGLANLRISATTTLGGASFSAYGSTNDAGNYLLSVFPATWTVSVDGGGLGNLGYQPVSSQQTAFAGGNVTVNFTAAAGGGSGNFSSWQSAGFTPAELGNPAISGPNADPDGDQISNFLEYALNLLPKLSDANGLPYPGTLHGAPGGGRYLTLTFRRRTDAPSLIYNVLEATSLTGPWTNVTASYEVIATDGATDTVRAKTVITPVTPRFLRLEVIQP